jgi:hypothetical protein
MWSRSQQSGVGQTVAIGVTDGRGGCSWTGNERFVSSTGEWVAIQIGSDCIARVGATWTGGLADGPADVVGAALPVDGTVTSTPSQPGSLSATTCKTGKEFVYTYGFGGPINDKMSKVWSALTYCYNDSFVWGTSTAGSACAGQVEPLGWSWVVDACVYSSQYQGQNATQVWSTVKGTYHCDPVTVSPCNILSGYHHHLFAEIIGVQSGHSTCLYWWDGSIVLGPNRDVISGCV